MTGGAKYFYNLFERFHSVASQHAERHALFQDTTALSYATLLQRVETIASFLYTEGGRQGDVIAIASTKVFDDYALMLACLRLGVTYTNLDVENPCRRILDIIETCRPKMIFGAQINEGLCAACQESGTPWVDYAVIPTVVSQPVPDTQIDGDTVAYIMFTSGSTGIPKGAAITHQNLLHFIAWGIDRFDISPQDRFANVSPMYFDNSVFDFYFALFSGASLTPISRELLGQPQALVQYADNTECTIWFSVPSMLIYLNTMKVLTKEALASVRLFVFGGEGFPKTELRKIFDRYSSRSQFVNVYGPTECTCICSSYTITADDFIDMGQLPPLGPLNPNFSGLVLDGDEISQEGELCLLGPNVGKGYFRDPERTKGSFSEYTGNGHYRKAMYRTGDLVKRIDGLLHFRGRVDNQIKHMGYRIELEEIEVALNQHPEILQAVAVYRRQTLSYGEIVAYVIPEVEELQLSQLKKALGELLPAYMIPSRIVILDSFPKNANGKVDRKQLAAQET